MSIYKLLGTLYLNSSKRSIEIGSRLWKLLMTLHLQMYSSTEKKAKKIKQKEIPEIPSSRKNKPRHNYETLGKNPEIF